MLRLKYYLLLLLLIFFYLITKKTKIKNQIEKFNNKNNITFVTGLFFVKNNKKHNLEHYKKYIIKTLNLLEGENIIFYYNNKKIFDYIPSKFKNIIFIKKDIKDLYTYKLSNAYLNSCKNQNNKKLQSYNVKNEKGLVHYKREYLKGGEEVFKKLFTIWTSKIFLIEDIMKYNPFKTKNFAWCDVSLSRFNKSRNINLYKKIYKNKLCYFKNNMKYYGKIIEVNASYLFANKDIWVKIIELYQKKLIDLKHSNYAHDEETILTLIFYENKHLFQSLN